MLYFGCMLLQHVQMSKRARHEERKQWTTYGNDIHTGYMRFLTLEDLAACTVVCRQQRSNVHVFLSKEREATLDMAAREPHGRLLEEHGKQLRRLTILHVTPTTFNEASVLQGLVRVVRRRLQTLAEVQMQHMPLPLFQALLGCPSIDRFRVDRMRAPFKPEFLNMIFSGGQLRWRHLTHFEDKDNHWADGEMVRKMLHAWSLQLLDLGLAKASFFTSCIDRGSLIVHSLRTLRLCFARMRTRQAWRQVADTLLLFRRLEEVHLQEARLHVGDEDVIVDDHKVPFVQHWKLPATVRRFYLRGGECAPPVVYGEHLDILHLTNMGICDVASIVERCPELQTLVVASDGETKALDLSRSIRHEKLSMLTIRGMYVPRLSNLGWFRAFPRLLRLSLPLSAPAESGPILTWLQGMPALNSLELSVIFGGFAAAAASSSSCDLPLVKLPSLHYLELYGQLPQSLFDQLHLPNVGTLHVKNNSMLASLQTMLGRTERLNSLMLHGLPELSTLGAHALPQLTQLELVQCDALTDHALLAVLEKKSPPLRLLTLHTCAKLSDAALAVVAAYAASRLEHCSLRELNVSHVAVGDLIRLAPRLKTITVVCNAAFSSAMSSTVLQRICQVRNIRFSAF